MKDREYLLLTFSIVFLFLANFLNNFIKKTNYVDPFEDIDSKAYIYNAEKFYKHDRFVLKKSDKEAPYFALGYSAFMGLIYKYFKPNVNNVIWAQIFLTLLTCFLIFNITSLIFGSNIGVIAFILSTLNIGFITFSNFILTESLLTFLLTLFLYLFILFLYRKKILYLLLSGLVLGISVWVKPAAIYFIFPILLLILFLVKLDFNFRLKSILIFALSFYLPVVSYMYYNKVNFGYFSVATLGNENLYFYFLPKVMAAKNNTTFDIERHKIQSMISGSKLDPNNWHNVKEYFYKNIKNNIYLSIKIWLKNVSKTMLGLYSTNLKVLISKDLRGGDLSFFKTKGTFIQRLKKYVFGGTDYFYIKIISLLEALWIVLRYLLILLGLLFLLHKFDFKYLFLFIFFIFYFAMITGHDGCARFRMMFEPALIILAAQGFFVIYYRLRYKFCPYGEL